LLAFARRQPLLPRTVDVNTLVSSIKDMLERTMGEDIAVCFELAGDLPAAHSDPNQLESALLNLVLNARDAMPHGGTLTIETLRMSASQVARHADDLAPGEYVCMRISDTGAGMSSDMIARAFDPFFTTKPMGQGTGLGLSMVHGFVRQSGGTARISSHEGEGTTVELCLPVAADDVVGTVLASETDATRRIGPDASVLVVEDDPAVRMIVASHLQDLGYRVIEAAAGPEGLDLLQSRQRIDLVVADVGLPGLNGRQMVEAARQHRPDLKVLFVTGYADARHDPAGLPKDTDLLAKPFELGALTAKVEALLARH
jgi:CheY-like chemotaxis protein